MYGLEQGSATVPNSGTLRILQTGYYQYTIIEVENILNRKEDDTHLYNIYTRLVSSYIFINKDRRQTLGLFISTRHIGYQNKVDV